jgi:hypothetical protein
VPVDLDTSPGPSANACWIEPARPRIAAAAPGAEPPGDGDGDSGATAPASADAPAAPAAPTDAPAAPAPAAAADAPEPPSLRRSGRKSRRAAGQRFRALGLGLTYQWDSSDEDATDAELSIGVIPDDTDLGGVELGAEVLAAGSLEGGSFDSGTVGLHGWINPRRLTLALFAVGGVAGKDAPEHGGPNPVFQGSAGAEYELGPDDTPWLTLGAAVEVGVQSRMRIGDDGDEAPPTFIARALTLGGVANASLTVLYGPRGSATAQLPRLEVWAELEATHTGGDRTSTSPLAGPTVLRPAGEHSELLATGGLTVNLPIAGSAHRVLSAGLFGGVHPQRDTIGGAAASSTPLLVGASLSYASRL